jgi:hypothetical protein
MQPHGSLLCLQDTTTAFWIELIEYSPHSHTVLLYDKFLSLLYLPK